MKKSKRKNSQLSFINTKKSGRPAINDVGIRHIKRPPIKNPSSLHLTIKVRAIKADIQSKKILKALHHAIKRARLKKLKILHYTLEYNHVHLLVEACSSKVLHQAMQALGISFSKAINKAKSKSGQVYKHRYHFKKLNSLREYKNARSYIFKNGIKHKRTKSLFDLFNSYVGQKRISADIKKKIYKSTFLSQLREELKALLDDEPCFFNQVFT